MVATIFLLCIWMPGLVTTALARSQPMAVLRRYQRQEEEKERREVDGLREEDKV